MHNIMKSPIFSEADTIRSICAPLEKLGIIGFFFFRVYKDQTLIDFATDSEWTEHFFNNLINNKYEKAEIQDHCFLDKKISLWEMNPHNRLWQDGKNLFDRGNGIRIISDVTENYTEICCFYSTKSNYSINEFYLNNLDILYNFIFYFKDQASELIEKFENKRISLPDLYKNEQPIKQTASMTTLDEFVSAIQPKRFHFGNTYLTLKEAECLAWLSRGKTASETALILSASKRTVEAHIDNIKHKLGRYTKAELLDLALKYGINNFFKCLTTPGNSG